MTIQLVKSVARLFLTCPFEEEVALQSAPCPDVAGLMRSGRIRSCGAVLFGHQFVAQTSGFFPCRLGPKRRAGSQRLGGLRSVAQCVVTHAPSQRTQVVGTSPNFLITSHTETPVAGSPVH